MTESPASVVAGRSLRSLAELPVTRVHRVGIRRAEALAALGIESVLDLVTHYPRRYVDRTRQADVAALQVGEESVVLAEVQTCRARRTRQGRALVELDVRDGTGALRITFFNQAWRAKQLVEGHRGLFAGKVGSFKGTRQLTHPDFQLLDADD
ncbi:MAG TPA: OB-fold nucleic acid binding domain-containing protein, partial [Acidimicrobiales bacterium]|nr:OB-fold nucleic acid binding domain-containing protein [Acidimicrobiales bacterium]